MIKLFRWLFVSVLTLVIVLIAVAAVPTAYQQMVKVCRQEAVLCGIIGFTLAYFLLLKKRIAIPVKSYLSLSKPHRKAYRAIILKWVMC